jgi:hypothetical protein
MMGTVVQFSSWEEGGLFFVGVVAIQPDGTEEEVFTSGPMATREAARKLLETLSSKYETSTRAKPMEEH